MHSEPGERWSAHYYRWSVKRTIEEFENDFPYLSRVLWRNSFKLIEYARSLEPARRLRLAHALAKRFNPLALGIVGEVIEREEQGLIEQFLEYRSAKEIFVTEQIESGRAQKGSRHSVKKMVGPILTEILGIPLIVPSGVCKYESQISGCRVRTTIDYGGSYGQITYAHSIIPGGRQPLQPPIHICGWMGIAGQTSWDLYTLEQEAEAADGLVAVISQFVKNWAPDLIATFRGGWPTL